MKNNISIVLNVVLLIAVVVLYVLHFSGEHHEAAHVDAKATPVDFSIAYVNSDSLLKNYDFFKQIEKKMNARQEKLNKEYQNRAQGLQKEIQNFQSSAGNMTISQAQAVQEDLKKKQQNLLMFQDQLRQQLMQEEAKANSELYDKVSNYLKGFGADKNLHLVLTYTKGSGVLYANDSLDITDEVLTGLNAAYQSGLAAKNDKSSKSANTKQPEATADSTASN